MLDFRIETFLSVCKYRSFTKAALELHITQPAVSQHIRHLEKQYHCKLFTYNKKRLELTDAGRLLFQTASSMHHDVIHLETKLADIRHQKKSLQLGATMTIGEFVMPDLLTKYLQSHPDVLLHMEVANTQHLLEKLDQGTIDFAIVEGYFNKNLYDSLVFSRENFIGIVGMQQDFSNYHVKLEHLLNKTLITREQGSGTRDLLEKNLEQQNFSIYDFSQVMEINNIHAIKTFVKNNLGISFLYEKAVEKELSEKTLQKIPLSDFHITHDFTFVWKKNSIFFEEYQNIFEEFKKTI